jgi:hypothetical protein
MPPDRIKTCSEGKKSKKNRKEGLTIFHETIKVEEYIERQDQKGLAPLYKRLPTGPEPQ